MLRFIRPDSAIQLKKYSWNCNLGGRIKLSPGWRRGGFFRRRRIFRPWIMGRFWRRMIFGSWVLLIAASAAARRPSVVKIQSRDLEEVEDEVGKSAEEMTEEELKSGMKKLGIQEGKLTSKDRKMIDAEVRFCPECGSSLELDYVFCPYCGHKE